MATSEARSGETTRDMLDGSEYSSAREFAVDRLKSADGAMSPSKLADEYDCSAVHMRKSLRELVDQGEVDHVGHGQYAVDESGESTGESTRSSEDGQGVDALDGATVEDTGESTRSSEDGQGADAPDGATVEDTGTEHPSTDIGPHSEDHGTTAQNPGIRKKRLAVQSQRDEYERQLAGLVEDHDDRDDDSGEQLGESEIEAETDDADDGDDLENADGEVPAPVAVLVGTAVLIVLVVYWSRTQQTAESDDDSDQDDSATPGNIWE